MEIQDTGQILKLADQIQQIASMIEFDMTYKEINNYQELEARKQLIQTHVNQILILAKKLDYVLI